MQTRLMKVFFAGCLVLLLAAGGFLLGLQQQWWTVPREWNPFAPLHLADPLTPLTRWKLQRLGDDPEACLTALQTAPAGTLDYQPLADYTPVANCPLSNVVRLRASTLQLSSSFVARCPLIAAWALYEQHRLQPLAQTHFGQPVARLSHYGSFACRNIYHRENARRSDHATASALDVAALALADGTTISVLQDWDDQGEKGAFLRAAFAEACDFFGTSLGPDYNAAHANHFHFGLRGFGICR